MPTLAEWFGALVGAVAVLLGGLIAYGYWDERHGNG
jgi:hypothetical protein